METEEKNQKQESSKKVVKPTPSLVTEISVPSGRKDGKGTQVVVVYLAGGNPI